MNVNLSDDNMKDIIAKAVLDTLTPESRETMIQEAIKSLLVTPPSTTYGRAKAPLQEAFDSAVQQVAVKIAEEQLRENTEVQAIITKLIADAWTQLVLPERYSALVGKIVQAIESGLTAGKY